MTERESLKAMVAIAWRVAYVTAGALMLRHIVLAWLS